MIQSINARPSTRIKRAHLTATHEKKHNHKQGDTPSINGNIFSTNQARLQGSTGPPEHLNRHKNSRGRHNWPWGPPTSLPGKDGGKWGHMAIGRAPCSSDHDVAPPTLSFGVQLPGCFRKAVPNASLLIHYVLFTPINMMGGGKYRSITYLHLSPTF